MKQKNTKKIHTQMYINAPIYLLLIFDIFGVLNLIFLLHNFLKCKFILDFGSFGSP